FSMVPENIGHSRQDEPSVAVGCRGAPNRDQLHRGRLEGDHEKHKPQPDAEKGISPSRTDLLHGLAATIVSRNCCRWACSSVGTRPIRERVPQHPVEARVPWSAEDFEPLHAGGGVSVGSMLAVGPE